MNWFERHLNWSLLIGASLLPFVVNMALAAIVIAMFWGQLAPVVGSGMDGLSEEILTSTFLENLPIMIIFSLISIALSVFACIVAWWYLGQKARSKWFLFLFLGPGVLVGIFEDSNIIIRLLILSVALVCIIIFYRLENRRIGYGGDFGDDFAREPATDRWPDTGQFNASDNLQPKELDYRYVDDGRDVSAAGGEVPAKPPAEVREEAVEKIHVEAPAEAIEKSTVEAMEKTLEETTTGAMSEVPVEATDAPAEVQQEAPEEAIGESPAQAMEKVPLEAPAAAAAEVQPAQPAGSQPASQVPILLDDAGAVIKCFYHPAVDAVNSCSRCGQYVCSACNYVTGTHPICRNCWDKRAESPISAVPVKKQESPKLGKPGKRKPGKKERSREFTLLYEQALPVISAVVTRSADGLPASPLDLMEGLKLRPMLEYAKKLPKPQGKELQEAKKTFEQLLMACIKVAETAADFVSAGGQAIPTEANFARLADGIEKASALMGMLYQRMSSLSQPPE